MLLSAVKHFEILNRMSSALYIKAQDRPEALPHLHERLLGEFRGLERDESLQAGGGRPVGDVAQAAGRSLAPGNDVAPGEPPRRGRADGHAGRRADVDPAAGGAQRAGRAVGAH